MLSPSFVKCAQWLTSLKCSDDRRTSHPMSHMLLMLCTEALAEFAAPRESYAAMLIIPA